MRIVDPHALFAKYALLNSTTFHVPAMLEFLLQLTLAKKFEPITN